MKSIWNFKLTTRTADLLSFSLGFIGLFFGILSLLALESFWNSSKFSYDITIIAVIFDTLSAIFALVAFELGFSYYKLEKVKLRRKKVLKYELTAITLDMISFILGIFGWTLEVLSIVSLSSYWYDATFSYNVTFIAIVVDLSSALTALAAFIVVSKIHLHLNED